MNVKNLLTERLDYSQLPLNHLPIRMILAIENALRVAWSRVSADDKLKPVLEQGNEDSITALIQSELEELRQSNSAGLYKEAIFNLTERGSQLINYNAKNIKKSPDLIFRIKNKRPGLSPRLNIYDGIFVECKLITKTATVSDYIQNGLQRFVDGDYAWAVGQGLMMAYVRTSQVLPETLDAYFIKNNKTNKYNLISDITACNASDSKPPTFITKHNRGWNYPTNTPPGDIDIRHIWLSVGA